MRNPLQLLRDLGPAAFIVAQILFAGTLLSALLHPVFWISMGHVAINAIWSGGFTVPTTTLFIFDALNVGGGYAAFILLGRRHLHSGETKGFWKALLFVPVYWLMLTVAAWHAVNGFVWKRHYWYKTPHSKSRRHQN